MQTAKLAQAILRIEKLRADLQEYYDENNVEGEWLDNFGSWKDWESEADDRETAAQLTAYDQCLLLLREIQATG